MAFRSSGSKKPGEDLAIKIDDANKPALFAADKRWISGLAGRRAAQKHWRLASPPHGKCPRE
jgi:hypothetical protein